MPESAGATGVLAMLRASLLAVLVVAVATADDAPMPLVGKVVKIADGDTLTLLDAEKVQHKVRLNGIDCPEKKQAFGTRAQQALAAHVFGKDVRVEWTTRARYKRILGDVYTGELWINRQLVLDGFAWHFKRYSKDKRLADAENEAREAKRGLWVDPEPVPPWEFRKRKTAAR